jgi:hypothetical protein
MDVPRVVRRALAVSVPVAVLLLASVAVAGSPRVITQAQSGRTYHIGKGGDLTLRLSEKWVWTEPSRSPRGILELTPVEYFVDPGFREWTITGRLRGTAVLRASGAPPCTNCGVARRLLRITIVVR